MKEFNPSYFFDISAFSHAALFDNCACVWEVLPKISSYLQNQSLGKIEGEVSSQAFLVNPESISIGKGTIVEPGAYIKGPCIIGDNCSVRHGAYIRGNLITGHRCVVGHETEIKNAVLLNQAHAAHFAYVGDTILGNRVNLGAGTICANLRLDNQQVIIQSDGQKVETGLRKFGAIIGDFSQTGCNSVLNPGTLMGQNVWCYPCTNVGGFIPSKQAAKQSR